MLKNQNTLKDLQKVIVVTCQYVHQNLTRVHLIDKRIFHSSERSGIIKLIGMHVPDIQTYVCTSLFAYVKKFHLSDNAIYYKLVYLLDTYSFNSPKIFENTCNADYSK